MGLHAIKLSGEVSAVLHGPRREKTCLWVSDKASFKLVSSATETIKKIEISPAANLHTILYKKRTRALIRLCGCAGWPVPLLFTNHRRQVFSRRGPYNPINDLSREKLLSYYVKLWSVIILCMTPFMPSGISHAYQLVKSISNLKVVQK